MALRKHAHGLGVFVVALACLVPQMARAQFIGYVSPQTVQQQLATGVVCTGARQVFPVQNLGQTQHYLTIDGTTGTQQFQAWIEGIDKIGNPNRVSDVAEVPPNITATVRGTGYYPTVQVVVICTPAAVGQFTMSYSGAWATYDVTAGAYLTAQLDKPNFSSSPQNANQTDTFQTPFGSSAGTLFVQTSTGGAGQSINVSCNASQFVGGPPNIATFAIANSTAWQTFQVPDTACPSAVVSFVNNAVVGTLITDYVFAPPGSFRPAWRYRNITTNTNTQVKTGPGVLHTLVVGTLGTGETITLFDSAACAGTHIGAVLLTATDTFLTYDANFGTGLCITTSGTTPGDYTVTFQ